LAFFETIYETISNEKPETTHPCSFAKTEMEIRLLEKPVQLSQKKTGKKLYVHLDPNSQDWLTWFQAVTIHIFKRRRVGQKYNQVFNFKIFYLS
jgi:hypothetical protein